MHRSLFTFLFIFLSFDFLLHSNASYTFWKNLNLHPDLFEWHVRNNPSLKQKCLDDSKCKLDEEVLNNGRCWGFESDCEFTQSYSYDHLRCPKDSPRWPGTHVKEYQMKVFFDQTDFGYVRERKDSMFVICESHNLEDSYLECSDHLRLCRAKNIFFNFKSLRARNGGRYRDDIIHEGEVGGKCDKFNKKMLEQRADWKSYLQSWGYEFEHFKSYADFKVDTQHCDVIFEKPTIVIKLDASVNMYHHFCDFINLYASQFINGSFSQDIDIFWWDTFHGGFIDSMFGVTWKAFSHNQPHELIWYDKKKVCFKNALFPMLARQRLGLYYNMPLIDGCEGSGLFHAFSKHILYRLGVRQEGPILNKVRITLLNRETNTRRIVNVDELHQALQGLDNVEVKLINYDKGIAFLDQLKVTHNSDIFIGMHGSGLTHLLFLPDWAGVFEVYNCEDPNCYHDLARLRGIKYWTWSRQDLIYPQGKGLHPTMKTPHAKFTNYKFDVDEFVRIVKQMVEYVRRHPQFVKEQRKLRRKYANEEL